MRTQIRQSGEHAAVPASGSGSATSPLPIALGEEQVSQSGRYVDPVIGSDVAGYRVKQRLGVGGMGIVYEGEHAVIGKRVAAAVTQQDDMILGVCRPSSRTCARTW